eukprot:6591484-Prymnesium_polylepis.2
MAQSSVSLTVGFRLATAAARGSQTSRYSEDAAPQTCSSPARIALIRSGAAGWGAVAIASAEAGAADCASAAPRTASCSVHAKVKTYKSGLNACLLREYVQVLPTYSELILSHNDARERLERREQVPAKRELRYISVLPAV